MSQSQQTAHIIEFPRNSNAAHIMRIANKKNKRIRHVIGTPFNSTPNDLPPAA